jgi:hypothetical protein
MIIVKLSKFDTILTKQYTHLVPVIHNDNKNNPIGSCKLIRNSKGEFYGELDLDNSYYGEHYFYYTDDTQNSQHFVLDYINLTELPKKSPTAKLKDMIVKSID